MGNIMVRGLTLAVAIALEMGFVPQASADIRVFACEPEWAALVREIGGDKVEAFPATHARQDPHHIRARPSLIASIQRSDLLFCSGAGLEVGWLPILLRQGASANLQPGQQGYLMAAEHVAVLGKPTVLDRSLGDIHPEGNPHVHLDARNMAPLARELAQRLAALDKSNAAIYLRRAEDFERRWSQSLALWAERVETLKGMPVIAHHNTWAYLFHWLGLKQVAMIEPRPGIPPTPSHLADLLQLSRAQPIKAILRTPFDPPEASDWLSAKTGIPVLTLPYTVGKDAGPGALGALFEETITLLEAARSRKNVER
ncbi:MAG: zinc/manganese transport system substrate-binding protein [Gammaproteobacteria bacterium]|jgi:zinc/manganese transport system substrate-binding protein